MPTDLAPYGSWRSPLPASALVAGSVGLSDLAVEGDDLYWSELRPNEAARQVLVRRRGDGDPEDLFDPPFSARTLVHEYGGRCYVVGKDGTVFFSNHADQRIYAIRGGTPEPVTAEPSEPRAVRYADFALTADGTRLIAVRERHDLGAGPTAVVNELVAVATDGSGEVVIAGGHDFYAAPRVSPDGARLAWISWDHPNMPWDGSELFVGDLGPDAVTGVRAVAGGPAESISQPRFSPGGVLHYLSDRSGFSAVYDEGGRLVAGIEADIGGPDWVFGQSSYAFLGDLRTAVVVESPGGQRLAVVTGGRFDWIEVGYSALGSLSPRPGGLVALAGSATEPTAVVEIDLAGATVSPVRASREVPLERAYLSTPRPIEFPTGSGRTAYGLYYPPTNPDFAAPAGELPPLVVQSHGGPTSKTSPALNLRTQFLTTRGIAVVDINYGGSSGFGREYRERLRGTWGLVDVEDCANAAAYLAENGLADPNRLAIHGGSAGGFTTLAALCFTDVFAVGASHYGVSDLMSLASDTHKFESRYLDGLLGPLPDAADRYYERSPINHVDRLSCPIIFFQGLEDEIVPPDQAERMVSAMRERGIPVALLTFEGEQHGFRRAETIVSVAEVELAFFGRVLGFTPADPPPALVIDNEAAL